MLKVFTTSREMRSYLLSCDPLLPPPYVSSIYDFESKAVVYPRGITISDHMRVILMKKACDDVPVELLGFDKDFLHYLKTRDFLFRFFDELAGECVEISDLSSGDTYAFFDDHLRVLSHLRERYLALVDEYGCVDKMTQYEAYELNIPYLQGCKEINFYLQGYLTNFEWEIFTKISEVIPLKIYATLSRYHQKLNEKVISFGFDPFDGAKVCIDLTQKSVSLEGELPTVESLTPYFFPVTTRLLQVGMIKEIIYEWVNVHGLDPEKIVVVTPDEGFAKVIKEWDDEGLFNLAMGKEEEKVFLAMSEYAKSEEENNLSLWSRRVTFDEFGVIVDPFCQMVGDLKMAIEVKKQLFELSLIVERLGGTVVLREIFYLFLEMMSEVKKDDISGGKVKVLGVLETRGMSFDGVIVVDFNESVVPKPNVKDSFLNSYVRQIAGLPTRSDRENLQKLYYDHLFRRSRFQAIGYVENESLMRSRFVDEMFGKQGFDHDEASRNFGCSVNLLKTSPCVKKRIGRVETHTMMRRTAQSATSLNTYMACPRKYYWRYGKGLMQDDVQSEHLTIGNVVHAVLAQCGANENTLHTLEDISFFVREALEKEWGSDPVWVVEKKVWHERIMAWAHGWVQRRSEGVRVVGVEIKKDIPYRGITLEGRFDWVEQRDDGTICIVDFKTSMIDEKDFEPQTMKSFQTVVYALVGKTLGDVHSVGLMGLAQNLLITDRFVEEKIPLLDRIIDELADEHNTYEMCDEKKKATVCRYCEYRIVCGRE